jgi:hypothetical protein
MNLLNILTVIFVIAKIVGYIDWSWWLVFAPTLFSFTLFFAIAVLALIAGVKK